MTARRRTTGAIGNSSSLGSETITTCSGSVTVTTKQTVWPEGFQKYIDDVVTPGFKTKSSKGIIVNNPVYINTHEASGQITGMYVKTRKSGLTCTGSTEKVRVQEGYIPDTLNAYDRLHPIIDAAVSQVLPSLVTLAGTSAMSSMKEPDVMLGVTLLEREETLRMLRRPQGRLIDLLKSIRNQMRKDRKWRKRMGRRKVAITLGNYIIDRWLMYRYGIMPLVYDIQGLMKAATAPIALSAQRHTARGKACANVDSDGIDSYTEYTTTRSHNVGTASAVVCARAGIMYVHTMDMRNRYGLSLGDIPSTLWESIPLSFVPDWAINIGDYLQAIQIDSSTKILSTWTTVEQTRTHEYTRSFSAKTDPNYNISDSRVGVSRSITWSKSRKPGVSVGLASKISTMSWRPTDLKHLADGFSLIAVLWQSKY